MSLLSTIHPKDATGQVKEIYDNLQKMMGMVPNAMQAFSVSPHRLSAQAEELGYYMAHPSLGRTLTAAIRYTVAKLHGCDYCVMVNGGMLKQAGWSEDTLNQVTQNPGVAQLEAKDKALFLTVVKAVTTPKEVNENDIGELRKLGWTDEEIFDAVAHGAFSIAFDTLLSAFDVRLDG